MPIAFTCPHCGKQTDVAEHFTGRTGPCGACGQMITIPGFSPGPSGTIAGPPATRSPRKWLIPVVVVVATLGPLLIIGLVLAALLLPSMQAARRTQCNNHLKNIALSLQNYHDRYKCFPAGATHAGVAGVSERIGPSWWVGTLPFCEQRNIYEKMLTLQEPGAPGNGAFNAQNQNAHIPGAPLSVLTPSYMRCPSSPLPVMEAQTGPVLLRIAIRDDSQNVRLD